MNKEIKEKYPIFLQRYFHIITPYWGAWKKYNWQKGDFGLGLNKKRIDELAENNMTCVISFGKIKNPSVDFTQEYTIKAKEVQKFPIEKIKNSKVSVYIIPKSSLNYKKKEQDPTG